MTGDRAGTRAAPGRKLPATIADFTSSSLPAAMILELVQLVRSGPGSFKRLAMAAHADTTDTPRPTWAIGAPGDDARARACSKQLSKLLGKGARKTPDWTTVAWVLRLCVADPDLRAQTTTHFAGLWQQATGAPAPATPPPATDDDMRHDLLDQLKRSGHANAELRDRVLVAQLELRREREANQRIHQELRDALDRKTADKDATIRALEERHRRTVDNNDRRIRALTDELESTRHNAAVLAAHAYTTHDHDRHPEIDLTTLLPFRPATGTGLTMQDDLRTMLNPDRRLATKATAPAEDDAGTYNLDAHLPDRTVTTWLRAYLRAMLIQSHPGGLFTDFTAEQAGQITAFVDGTGPCPTNDTLRALITVHPRLAMYLPSLVSAVRQPGSGRAVLVSIPKGLVRPAGVPRAVRHTADARHRQVTVAELYARGDIHKKPRARATSQATTPATMATKTATTPRSSE